MTWARFEWEPGGKASPLNNPTPCNHLVVGNVFILPGPEQERGRHLQAAAGPEHLPAHREWPVGEDLEGGHRASLRRDAVSGYKLDHHR